ncbi:response regulator [Desulfogranum mediterraneum]|uniref:response regulator n=1 Tax=Desulfogranum mediterraneum TaxID=160661 RepID=UPI0004276E0F|nr:response regulator [Desulfogranum mediterraneum]
MSHDDTDRGARTLELVRLLQESTHIAAISNLCIALITFIAIPSPHQLWLWLIITVSAMRVLFVILDRKKILSSMAPQTVFFILIVLIALQGMSWGFASIQLYACSSDIHRLFLIAVVVGMSGGALMALAPSMLAYTCFMLPCCLPLVVTLLMQTERPLRLAGLTGVVFMSAIYLLAKRMSSSHLELISSRKKQERTSQELERHKNSLEILVEERTKELKASREKYRQLTEEINDAIYHIDRKGTILYISPAVSSILGYLPEQLIGRAYTEYIYPEDIPLTENVVPQIIKGNSGSIECRMIDSSGKLNWVRASNRPVIDNGKLISLRGILSNIEDEKKSAKEKEELLTRMNENQKFEAIGTLAGGIAHDFNNLLMGIQGHCSLLSLTIDPSHPHLEHIDAIENHVHKASALTAQLLGTAKGGKYDIKPRDLNKVIKSSATMFSRTRKGMTVTMDITPSPLVADVDQHQIEQVLLNLYVNAWQAIKESGELHLMTEKVALDRDFCKPYETQPGPYAKISVTDNGIGMDEATCSRIFNPFFTTKEKGRGTGLGLSSAYGIIKNHNGIITVYSKLGRGTTFHIYLPLSEQQTALHEPKMDSTVLTGTETILFVDDEDLIVEVGSSILTKLGYRVIVAKSGREALAILEKSGTDIDLVILDLIMPDMDGEKTFDQIRTLFPEKPIILSSGYSADQQAARIIQRGCNGFLQKPFTVSALSCKLREVLDGKEKGC